jgi:pimeloyl-ACP methyl ester carboxylesterase
VSFLVSNGVRTHYQRVPAKDPQLDPPPLVVCVHGMGYDSLASYYLTLAPPLAAAGIDVLAYDLRSHGRSDRPATGYRMADFTTDLAELLNGIGVTEPVHLLGNSFGGTIAFAFAARHPDRVRSIVSIESQPPTEEWAEQIGAAINASVSSMESGRFLAWIGETFGEHAVRLSANAAKIIRATTILTDVPSGPHLTETELADLTCPVLSIVGSAGVHGDNPRVLDDLLPNCRTEVITDQNHSVLVDRHQEIRPLILEWVLKNHPETT